MMIETLAKLETKIIQTQKQARRNRIEKIVLQILIGIFFIILTACIELIK